MLLEDVFIMAWVVFVIYKIGQIINAPYKEKERRERENED